MEQIVILGNGFDLSVGMKTNYEDFLNVVEEKLPVSFHIKSVIHKDGEKGNNIEFIFRKLLEKNVKLDLDFWTLLFLMLKEEKIVLKKDDTTISIDKIEDWKDVEKVIEIVLKKILIEWNAFERKDVEKRKSFFYSEDSDDRLLKQYFADWYLYVHDHFGYTKLNVSEILKKELTIFENRFAEYLSQELNDLTKKRDISERDSRLQLRRTELLGIVNSPDNFDVENTQILNFNYTPIFKLDEDDLGSLEKQLANNTRYIHGALKFENKNFIKAPVIFGIDDTHLKDEEKKVLYNFGKTYRVITNQDKNTKYLDLNKKIDYIKFFGHSLNRADYAYFQSIFDKVDIYGSDVKLIFFSSAYNEKNKSEFLDSIYKLFDNFGKENYESTSKIKGRNLLNKLNLEGRLKIIPISKELDQRINDLNKIEESEVQKENQGIK